MGWPLTLGGVDALMAEQRADLFQIAMLGVHLHGDPVTQVVGLELGDADLAAIEFSEPPKILAVHRLQRATDAAAPPLRPEERGLGCHVLYETRQDVLDVRLQVLR